MRILIADKISEKGIASLRDNGYDVDVNTGLPEEEIIRIIADYDAIIIRSATRVTRAIIEAGTNLKIIGRAGVGVDNVDVDAATEQGVIVCNAPTSNVISAAEQTFALMLASARKTAQANASMQAGLWERSKFSGNELYEKTLAIFGLGRIGTLVAKRAAAFGMRLIGYDPYISPERAQALGVTVYDSLEEILPQADFITVHLPKTKETIGMFGPEQFAMMKPTVYLVNAARGGIYDIDALAEAAKNGKIAGAALDVYEKEPCTDSPVHGLPNVILTPHLGASTKEAQDRAGEQIAEFVMAGLRGEMVPTALNVSQYDNDVLAAITPYVSACETAGRMLSQLASDSISALQVMTFGELAAFDPQMLGTAVLMGIIDETSDDKVNLVNANYLADIKGIHLDLATSDSRTGYTSMVRLRGRAKGKDVELALTLTGDEGDIRIVDIQGYKFDIMPSENMLIMQYVDGPGRMGKVCSILGDAQINIARMEVCDGKDKSDIATVVFNIDDPCTESVKEKLANAFDLHGIWYISL
ncbi:MAG: phosphoglycerate dehydrogenase [Coriobacteriales bacterium]|nr:phosphoglycerate dehydrogenase [Coriobacteriales bacterium]